MLIAPKQLKLRTSYLTDMFTGTVRTWPLKNFSKSWRGQVTWPPKFLVLRADHTHLVHRTATKWTWCACVTKFVISHFLTYFLQSWMIDRSNFTHKRREYKRFICTMAHKCAWSGNVTKFVILRPLNYFLQQLMVEYSNFTQSLL